VAVAVLGVPAAATAQSPSGPWNPVSGALPASRGGEPAPIQPEQYRAFTLDAPALSADLDSAPIGSLDSRSRAAASSTVMTLPAPDGTYQRFRVEESSIMEPGLAARHPDIKTYDGVGIDDPTATVAADTGPLGFHASVRAATGPWYIDPYYRNETSAYISYYGRDLLDSPHGTFVENGVEANPALDDDIPAARATPTVQLRTYRLALVTDPAYATYFGGSANVTAAKVTLMNRVDQVYEDESAIRMVLVANDDLLNLDTTAQATGTNGPCGAAACFTSSQISTCGSSTLTRNRIVVGQLIGAANYDIGHIALGVAGGGIASLGVVGGGAKAQGCTGLQTPVGDFFAIDYVAHEMGHEFGANHPFNGTQSNCSGANRNAATSVEPGSGSSIMAYAGICAGDNLQPHSDPYFSQRSYDEIAAYTSTPKPAISEVQNVSLRNFAAGDSLTLGYATSTSAPIVDGTNYTASAIQAALQGPSEQQSVELTGYDTDADSYTLTYNGATSDPIVRGQNNTAAGVGNAIRGGNEQQQVTLGSFSSATQSFQVQIGGQSSAVIGSGGVGLSNPNIAAAINAISGFAGTVTVSGTSNTGFTVTFGGASAATDVPSISIVNCSGGCTTAVRETAKGGTGLSSWPPTGTVTVSTLTDSGYQLTFSGSLQGTNVDPFTVTNASGTSGAVLEVVAGGPGIIPAGATATVAGFGGGAFDETGFQVTFGTALANVAVAPLTLAVTGATGFVGETAQGGPVDNGGFTVTDTGNHPPVVTVPAGYTIPTRTPFSLTGSATDSDGDPLTYMWEQNDRGGATGTTLFNNTKTNGPLFRQFGTAANVSATDTLLTPSPGENAVTTDPTRVFPDLEQIIAGTTNAQTGQCPAAPASPTPVPPATLDCYSEFLPTSDWVGFLGDRTMHFRLTARDGRPGGGGVGSADTAVVVAPLAGPFLVTSQDTTQTLHAGAPITVTWDVAGTDAAPVNTSQVRIMLSTDGGRTFPYVLAAATANDGSADVVLPNVLTSTARIEAAPIGNVYFDMSDVDLPIVAASVATPSPAAHNFGSQTATTSSAPTTITISNTGTADLNISAASLTGTDHADFQTSNDTCSGTTVATSDSCTVDVVFAPLSAGAKHASLSIASDAPASPAVVDLTGEGAAPPPPPVTTTTTTTAPAPPASTVTSPSPPPTTLTTTTTTPATTTATTTAPEVPHPTSLHAVLGSSSMLTGAQLVAGCETDQPSITTCTVSVAGTSATAIVGHRGERSATVRVALGAAMLHRVQRSLSGVSVRAAFTATGYGTTQVLRASAATRLLTARVHLVPPTHFAAGSASLNAATRRYLTHVAHALGHARRVTCVGYTSTGVNANSAYRRDISRRRAAAACAQLRTAGLRSRFAIVAGGSSHPLASNASARGRARNRRFELTIIR
jgi:outer membrane protein OmpA-like peptidoglycan-associated protein